MRRLMAATDASSSTVSAPSCRARHQPMDGSSAVRGRATEGRTRTDGAADPRCGAETLMVGIGVAVGMGAVYAVNIRTAQAFGRTFGGAEAVQYRRTAAGNQRNCGVTGPEPAPPSRICPIIMVYASDPTCEAALPCRERCDQGSVGPCTEGTRGRSQERRIRDCNACRRACSRRGARARTCADCLSGRPFAARCSS